MKKNKNLDLIIILASITVLAIVTAVILLTRPYEARTIEDIKTIYEKYPKIIKGFGELKCYNEYKGEKVPYKKISFVRQVCRYSMDNGNLPVYLHWDICDEKDVQKLSKLLRDYPTVPVVLCHCGMNETNQSYAYTQVCQLMKQYQNQ